MMGLDKLIEKLKDLRVKEAEEEENLKTAQKKAKEAKSNLSKIKLEMFAIVDELSGKKSFPLFDELVAEPKPETKPEIKLIITEPITFERVGKRGSDFDCVFFHQGENTFDLSFDKIELKLIGEDPASYKDYLELSDTAWRELQVADQETLQELIKGLESRKSDRFAWIINESGIVLIKGKERKIVPDKLVRLIDLDNFTVPKCKNLWERLEQPELEEQKEVPATETNFKKSFHEQYQEARMKDPFDIWVTADRKIEMTFRGEKRTFGNNEMIGLLCAYFRVPQLSDIAQISLAELWHNTDELIKQIQPKPKLVSPVKPTKTKTTNKKKPATVGI